MASAGGVADSGNVAMETIENMMEAARNEESTKAQCFTSAVKMMDDLLSSDHPESCGFVSIYVPMADIKKPGIHFLVAINTNEGTLFLDSTAAYMDEKGKLNRGTISLQDDYLESMIDGAKAMGIPTFSFAAVRLTSDEFKIFYPGVVQVCRLVSEKLEINLTNGHLRECMLALKSFYHADRRENVIIEMVIFEVFYQVVSLEGDARSEDFSVAMGHDFRKDIFIS